MEKLHRQNLVIVWCSIIALSLVSLMDTDLPCLQSVELQFW